jgi:hypothetical protein
MPVKEHARCDHCDVLLHTPEAKRKAVLSRRTGQVVIPKNEAARTKLYGLYAEDGIHCTMCYSSGTTMQ